MNDKLKRFLPIGTVVLLKGAQKRLMITGFCSVDGELKNKVYDYTGCPYPEGIIDSNHMALFNHTQIEKVFYLGLSDNEEKQFKANLVNALTKMNNK